MGATDMKLSMNEGHYKRTLQKWHNGFARKGAVHTNILARPSERLAFASHRLNQAGFKIGPGVNLKAKP
jgi:hypothetical protein